MSKGATWDRIGAVSRIAFAMLIVVSIQLSLGTSDTTTSSSDIAGISAIDYNQRAEELRIGAFLLTAAVFFLFWFLPLLHHRLEWAQGEPTGCRPSRSALASPQAASCSSSRPSSSHPRSPRYCSPSGSSSSPWDCSTKASPKTPATSSNDHP
jgi:hypothetical protein